MKRILAGDFEYAVTFRSTSVQRLVNDGVETVDQTGALVHQYEPGEPDPIASFVGFAYRAPDDAPDEWEGRLWALSRAVGGSATAPGVPTIAAHELHKAFWAARDASEALDDAMAEAERQQAIRAKFARVQEIWNEAHAIRDEVAFLEYLGRG